MAKSVRTTAKPKTTNIETKKTAFVHGLKTQCKVGNLDRKTHIGFTNYKSDK